MKNRRASSLYGLLPIAESAMKDFDAPASCFNSLLNRTGDLVYLNSQFAVNCGTTDQLDQFAFFGEASFDQGVKADDVTFNALGGTVQG